MLHLLSLAGRRVKVHLPPGFTPSHVDSLGFTWAALLAPLSFLQKHVATNRLLWMGMEANRAPASLWKRAMDGAQPRAKEIRWRESCSTVTMQISSPTILWEGWRSKGRTSGGKQHFWQSQAVTRKFPFPKPD